MCSIFGSTDLEEFYELARINSYRGTHSHSIATYHKDKSLIIHSQDFGPMVEHIDLPRDCLYIGHQQAPTTEAKSLDNIHPSKRHSVLWHNGIIKSHQVKDWQLEFVTEEKWDTRLLQMLIEERGYNALSEADGSFACLHYWNESLRLFRNDNCPMFVKGSSFSSTMFDGAESLKSQVVYDYNDNNWIETETEFKTANLFYWSPV